MPLIVVYSPKGGVGKTTLSASLCYSFSSIGTRTLAVDLDPQNALKLHFGVPVSDDRGLCEQLLVNEDWNRNIINRDDNIYVLPFGRDLKCSSELLSQYYPRYFEQLEKLLNQTDLLIVVDLATANENLIKYLLPLIDIVLIPLLSDTASLALLPRVEQLISDISDLKSSIVTKVILNKMDFKSKVCVDVENFAKEHLNEHLIGNVHKDYSIIEANAYQKSVFELHPSSMAAYDINSITNELIRVLKDSGHYGFINEVFDR